MNLFWFVREGSETEMEIKKKIADVVRFVFTALIQ